MPSLPIVNRRWSDRSFAAGRSARETYDVTGVDTDQDAVNAVGISVLSTHPQDARLVVPAGGIDVAHVSPIMRRVSINWETKNVSISANPLDDPADCILDYVDSQEEVERDFQGTPIVDSALFPFSTALYDETCSLGLIIAQWESTFDAQKVIAYTYPKPTLNEDVVTIPNIGTFQPGQLKIKKVRCETAIRCRQSDPTQTSIRMLYYLEARGYYKIRTKDGGEDTVTGFAKRVRDQGFQALYKQANGTVNIGNIIFPVKNENGRLESVSSEVLLDGFGGILDTQHFKVHSLTDTPTNNPNALPDIKRDFDTNAVYLMYVINKPMPFAGLGFKFQ